MSISDDIRARGDKLAVGREVRNLRDCGARAAIAQRYGDAARVVLEMEYAKKHSPIVKDWRKYFDAGYKDESQAYRR